MMPSDTMSPTHVSNVQFPASAHRPPATAADLHPSRMTPEAYFCFQCERDYNRPPVDQLDVETGALMRRLCGVCRCEAIEILESPGQSREAAAFTRQRNAGERLVRTQPVVMRVVETLPDGTTMIRVTQVHVPFDGSHADNRNNLFAAMSPFGMFGGMQHPGGMHHAGGAESLDQVLGRLFAEAQAAHDGRGHPAKAEDLARLRRFTATGDDADACECTVCMEAPAEGDLCVELPCKHAFHEECLKPWMAAHDTCPTCRRSIAQPQPAGQQPNTSS